MRIGGFPISPRVLDAFSRCGFHYWNHQDWVLEGMMTNLFGSTGRVYECDGTSATGCFELHGMIMRLKDIVINS
ncbi:ABC transporter [Apiospora marii]|uniref:ABC transporter n=1 Tax=Apiospora marii TaxID=335849 RepID=UPI00312CC32B